MLASQPAARHGLAPHALFRGPKRDGFADIVHCDYRENSNGNYHGYYTSEIYVFWGSSERYSIPSPQSISSVGSQIYSASGGNSSVGDGHNVLAACGIMPDWNGDGMDELWAYITQSDSSFTGVYVFDGNADWVNGADLQPLSDASYFLVTGSNAPVSVFRNIGDWDGDSIDDVAIGFGVLQSGGGNQAWVMGSTQTPALTYSQANILATIEGDDEYNQIIFGNCCCLPKVILMEMDCLTGQHQIGVILEPVVQPPILGQCSSTTTSATICCKV